MSSRKSAKETSASTFPESKPKHARVAAKYTPTDDDRKKVYLLAGIGDRNEDVALVMGVSERALRMHYPSELAKGRLEANAKVKQTAFRMATSGDYVAMTIFWLKTRCAWKETDVHEVTGRDGGPIEQAGVVLYLPDNGRGE